MQTPCPSCGTQAEVSPGHLKNCAECGHWWVPPAVEAASQAAAAEPEGSVPLEFELQFADGDRWQGPFDRFHLREMLYTERLTGQERIRVPGSVDSAVLAERPEFSEVLTLLGKEEEQTGRRSSIVGWKKGGSVAEAAEAEKARREEERRQAQEERIARAQGPSRRFVVGGLVAIAVLLVGLVATLLLT